MLDSLNSILLAAEQGIKYETAMNVLMAFVILMVVAAVAIIVVIMMQKGTNDNAGVITGAFTGIAALYLIRAARKAGWFQ